jgi:hypothetical protein
MKKVISIFSVFLLSALLCSHAGISTNAAHHVHFIGCHGSTASAVADNCGEDMMTRSAATSFHPAPAEYLPGDLNTRTSPGISSFIWQPPE